MSSVVTFFRLPGNKYFINPDDLKLIKHRLPRHIDKNQRFVFGRSHLSEMIHKVIGSDLRLAIENPINLQLTFDF